MHTARTPNIWVLSGGAVPSRDWVDIGWDVSEKLVYQTGFICPYAPYNIKIWLYKYINISKSLIGHQKCDQYNSVFAPGTLGILPDTYLVPVSNGLGDRHIKNATMGFINVTERNHCMTIYTAFIHINTSLNNIHHITVHGR